MFAWAKHAQPTELANDVGFPLQPDEYLVLQVRLQKNTLQKVFWSGALCKTSTKRSEWSGSNGEAGKTKVHSRWMKTFPDFDRS